MSASVLYMSVSLDGYISTADDYLGGEDGEREVELEVIRVLDTPDATHIRYAVLT